MCGIFQIGYFVSRIVHKLTKQRIEYLLRFSGYELIQEMRKYIKGFKSLNDKEILFFCNELIREKYIKPIATNYVFGGIFDTIFCNSSLVKYELYLLLLDLVLAL